VIDRRGALWVASGSAVAGVVGLAIMVVTARVLTDADFAQFMTFWSLLFAGYAVVTGVNYESARATGAVVLDPGRARGRVLPVALGIGATLGLVVAASGPWWRPVLMPGRGTVAVLAVALSLAAYTGYLAVVGALMGHRRWHVSASMVGADGVVRLVLVVVALALATNLDAVEVAVAATALMWVVALVARPVRGAAKARADVPAGRLVLNYAQAMAAGVGSAALVVGFLALLRTTTDQATWDANASLILAVTLTRGVLLMPLNAFQGAAIGYFLDARRPRAASLVRLAGLVVGVGSVAAVAAGLVGPALVRLLVPGFGMSGWMLAALVLAVVPLALLVLFGAVTLALGKHLAYAAGWLVAAGVAYTVMRLGLRLDLSVVAALAAGPSVGAALHLSVIWTSLRRPATSAPPTPGRRGPSR